MIGMRYDQGLLFNRGSGIFSRSFDVRLELNNAICQLTLADVGEFDPGSRGLAEMGFTEFAFLDADGHTVHVPLPDITGTNAVHALAHNRMVSLTYAVRVSNAFASWVINMFFWESVFGNP